jgi:putative membrane protein
MRLAQPGKGLTTMPPIAQALALVAALLHGGFFYLESIAFRRPQTWTRFGLASQEQAEIVRPMAFNQGFYNLFLALGVFGGLVLVDFAAGGAVSAGIGITKFALASMVLAGAVLLATGRGFRRAALLQALPPALALLASVLA